MALKGHQQIILNRLKHWIDKFMENNRIAEEMEDDEDLIEDNKTIIYELFKIMKNLLIKDDIPRVRVQHVPRTIDSFSESDCWIRFHFLKDDLHRVLRCLRLDQFSQNNPIIMDNHSRFTCEEILLFSIERFSYPRKLFSIVKTYGKKLESENDPHLEHIYFIY